MQLAHFDPPALLEDFDAIANQRDAWSEAVSFWFDAAVRRAEREVGAGNSQFYNPMKTDTDDLHATKDIAWLAFPKVLLRHNPGNKLAAWKAADQLGSRSFEGRSIRFRRQDEYCEWHVTRRDGKIAQVTFTCEGPEYWAALAQGYANGYDGPRTAGTRGDPQQLLALYRAFISSRVQLEDLFLNGRYNPWNKWNTTYGAMHLTHPANSLQAEIFIAADATVLRAQNGATITDEDQLIRCGQFGVADRASDPHIGGEVNALARQGASITLLNPVGLYMDSLDTVGWTKPDGSPVGNYWTPLRGAPGMTVRAVYKVPPEEGFSVSDIRIGGEAINYGGQIAEHITMRLTGVACRIGQSQTQPVGCGSPGVLAAGADAEFTRQYR